MKDNSSAPTVEIVEGIGRIGREQWNRLLAPDDSAFIDWDWLCAMEESHSASRTTGWAPHHLLLRDGATRAIVAACPLYLKSHSMGEFVFDHGWADGAAGAGIEYYPKLLVGVPFTPHSGRRFLTAPGADRANLVSILGRALVSLCADNKLSSVHVNFCAPDEAAILGELGFVERAGYQYHWRNDGFATFDDYLARLKSKRRYAVRHERAAMAAEGIEIRAHRGDEIPDSLFAPMYKLYRSTIDKLYWGRLYLTPRFFELMRENFKRHLCFICAYQKGELIAGTFNVQSAGTLAGRYWGCLRELRYLHFNVCYYAAIEHCITDRVARFEPGAGGEYKWLRGFDPAITRSMHYIANPSLRKAIVNFVKRERREVEAWIAAGHVASQLKAPPPSNVESP